MFGRLKDKPVSSVCLGDGMTLSQVANLIVTEAVVKCNCAWSRNELLKSYGKLF